MFKKIGFDNSLNLLRLIILVVGYDAVMMGSVYQPTTRNTNLVFDKKQCRYSEKESFLVIARKKVEPIKEQAQTNRASSDVWHQTFKEYLPVWFVANAEGHINKFARAVTSECIDRSIDCKNKKD